MVTYLSCPLVDNFRSKDVALGGQGAPLVPFGEKYLFADSKLNLNLGGFANMSYGNLGFDIAPCNIVMNNLVQLQYADMSFDEDGKLAAAGNCISELLQELNQLPFYKQAPPKSLGWEWTAENVFPIFRKYQPSLEDALCTYVEHVTDQIAKAIKHIQARNEKIVITGGGRHNPFLMNKLKEKISPYNIEVADNIGNEMIDFKEAIIFAFLGLRTLTNLPNTLTEVTGASMPAVSGAIHLPSNGWKNLLAK
jgi:anhydro-N-acetylmuramic acid kinase